MNIYENYHIVQHDLNAFAVKWRLKMLWVDKTVLNDFINKYDQAVHNIIYPEI